MGSETIYNDGPCRRCSECAGESHHWLEQYDDEHPAVKEHGLLVYWVCKHCDAWKEYDPDEEDDVVIGCGLCGEDIGNCECVDCDRCGSVMLGHGENGLCERCRVQFDAARRN